MNSKAFAAIVFGVVFIVVFASYFVLTCLILPNLDISSTAKQDLEIIPSYEKTELKTSKKEDTINTPKDGAAEQQSDSYTAGFKGMIPTEDIEVVTEDENTDILEDAIIDDIEVDTSDVLIENNVDIDEVQPQIDSHQEKSTVKASEPSSNMTEESNVGTITKELDRFVGDDNQSEKVLEGVLDGQIPVVRVVIKGYSTKESAGIASESIANMGLNLVPLVKKDKDSFILQLAAFSDKSRAIDLVTKLRSRDYQAYIEETSR